MKKYQCHKIVKAARIMSIETFFDGSAKLRFDDAREDRAASPEWMKEHSPTPGSYYVVYEDGYASFSPADAFESGYTEVI